MGSGWYEWPLVIFTVLGQCVAGGFIVMALVLLSRDMDVQRAQRINRMMFFLWVLMGVGFVASFLHLGSPLRAMNALNRLGSSSLSNEIAAGSLFLALGGLYWLLSVVGKLPAVAGRIWLWVTLIAALVYMYAMIHVYDIDTVPTWYNSFTPVHFIMTAVIGGPLLGYLLLRSAGETNNLMRWLPLVSLLGLVASIAANLMQTAGLAEIHSSVQQASQLIPLYGDIQLGRLILLVAGLGCWIYPLSRGKTPALSGLIGAMVLVVGGELLGRVIFYGLHMTVGMAVAG
ncbi:DmsC/YnfH family molybdoenzyme membrane anchor subunit [Brenneria uluponensis]|uniref:DmsC/YnfH family molybdoenzyme membrane anchor subunit n=1 Tax=Brenneria uluponensis TaxID=3057057 RepID=UPI0028E767C1|nr:DmsC/YnfH family molybdoenzyme membrane anchor subunit [Brenneria ulupoensis]